MSRIDGVIRAPIAGIVVEKLITPGQLLQAGTTPCFTVADLSRVWVHGTGLRLRLAAVQCRRFAPKIDTGSADQSFSGHGRQYRGTGRPRHPFRDRARGRRQSRQIF